MNTHPTAVAGIDPAAISRRDFLLEPDDAHRIASLNGSISAEHGIGRLKRDELAWRKSAVEMDMMRAVKHALDPQGRMNPGRVL